MIRLAGRLYDPDDRGPSVVTVEGGVVRAIAPLGLRAGAAPSGDAFAGDTDGAAARAELGGPTSRILPGLVDVQVNGAFGYDFSDPGADLDEVCRRLPELGVTAFVPTIVTSDPEAYEPALAHLRRSPRPGEARVVGAHVEGPFISPRHPGTHDPARLRPPDRGEATAWLAAGDVRWLTLAPELPGALDLTSFLAARGVSVSMGHSDATWSEAAAAVEAGASVVTHLFNAMRPFRHRDPGIAGFALASHLPVGVIADGHHLAFDTLRLIARVKAPDEAYLVTDALAGLGMPPGRYVLAGREYVSDGTCGRLPDGTLSGSLLPLNLAVRNLVDRVGVAPELAVRMATSNPVRALGLDPALGRIRVGDPANLVVVDDGWRVQASVAGGEIAFQAPGAASRSPSPA